MHYSRGLEYIVGSSYSNNSYSNLNYFSKNTNDNYGFKGEDSTTFSMQYTKKTQSPKYKNHELYTAAYAASHSFTPEIFLNPSRPKARFIDDNDDIKGVVEEIFELMMPSKVKDFCGTENPKDFLVNEKMPEDISINVLPFDDFRALHSRFGAWSNGILGFSINGSEKKIFARENHLDSLMLVIGHEIGHVLTETLPNKHDEEAKAFAFSIEWAHTIKKHNIANLGLSIKEEIDFQPARNGLHDVALSFVNLMVKKGRKAMQLHSDLVKKYVSVFDKVYF